MMALLEKDIRLILLRKSTLVIFIVIGVAFTWGFSNTFSGAYLTMLGTLLALSTLSYDDSDNCMEFLFTLPCTKRQYVTEKYLFVYGFSFIAGLIGMVIVIISNLVNGLPVNGTVIAEVLASVLPILVVTGGLMIPLQMKFGPEKSRIVLLAIIGAVFLAGYLISKASDGVSGIMNIINAIDSMNGLTIAAVTALALIIITAVSYIISTRIMNNKEY